MNLNRFLSGIVRQSTGTRSDLPTRNQRDDSDDGVGVPSTFGPRPLRGGAQAKPPQILEEQEQETVAH